MSEPHRVSDPCPKGGDHDVKFNGGNPVCLKCDAYVDTTTNRVVLPAMKKADGTYEVTS